MDIAIGVILIVAALFLIVAVLLQSGKDKKLSGAIGGTSSDTYYGKNKGSDKFVKSSITDATYTVKMAKKVDGRQAYCVVKDKYGKTAKSDVITLKMK